MQRIDDALAWATRVVAWAAAAARVGLARHRAPAPTPATPASSASTMPTHAVPKNARAATLLDAADVAAVVELVRRCAADDDADAFCERLFRLHRRFPPTEAQMRRLSVWQQQLEGTGGAEEYCVATVYGIATVALCNAPAMSMPRPRRARSE